MALTLKKRADTANEQRNPAIERIFNPAGGKNAKRKFLSGARFVLFIGDEGAILLYLKQDQVISRQFVPDISEQNLKDLRKSLEADANAPISFVLDSMDQTYTQQTLPPVNAMSVKKLIDRRLARDFAPQDIKGAVLLGREKSGRKDWNFLMISVERTSQIAMWLDLVQMLPNRFQGIYLVSVDSEVIIQNLEQAMGVPKEGTGAGWKLFVSHNKVGGFRQVVLRDGRIIFTRLSQPIGDSTPEVIAGSIEQEMLSTVEYMKRLAYNVESGLDIYVIASSAIQPLIDKSKFTANRFNIMTPFEVSQYLGIEGATQPTDQFGDVILAAAIASSPKHVLMLSTPDVKKFDSLHSLFYLQRILSGLVMLAILACIFDTTYDIYAQYVHEKELEISKKMHQAALDDLHSEIKRFNLDLEYTADMMEEYQLLLKGTVFPFSFLNKVQATLRPPIVIKHMNWSVEDKTGADNALLPPKMTVVFTLQLPDVADAKAFKAFSTQLIADLKASLQGFDIAFSQLPGKYTEGESLSVSFDNAKTKNETPDVTLTFKEQ